MGSSKETVRVAAIADIHAGKSVDPSLRPILTAASESADVLLMCGDLTDYGLPEEAHALAKTLNSTVRIPVVAVLGNHDHESAKQDEIRSILSDAGVRVLDGESCEIHGLGFAGVKGFAGGFGRHALEPWGEEGIKVFVRETVEQALKLESALSRLRTAQRVALLHYAPIQGTVAGEPLEIYPFLGSSRLEEPLNRYAVAAAFHGHAHRGCLEARTAAGVPVYNVSMSLLQRSLPAGQLPFRVLEIATGLNNSDPTGLTESFQHIA